MYPEGDIGMSITIRDERKLPTMVNRIETFGHIIKVNERGMIFNLDGVAISRDEAIELAMSIIAKYQDVSPGQVDQENWK